MSDNFWKDKSVLVTGGSGFLGSNVVRLLSKFHPKEIRIPRSEKQDLRKNEICKEVVKGINIVIHMAAKVGGIGFNMKNPGELFYDNLIMGVQLMEEARAAGVEKFVGVGTICAYPKFTPVPFREEDLWNGYPEETNAPYGLAKKMLLVQAQAYRVQYNFNAIYLLPTNLYGPEDNFNPESSHVIPALIKKFVDAKERGDSFVPVWGTGKATREFVYVEDCAEAIIKAAESYNKGEPINIGSSVEISIKDLADMIQKIVGFKGKIVWDITKPDGQPRRKLDVAKAESEFNFRSSTSFEEGLKKTIEWYLRTK